MPRSAAAGGRAAKAADRRACAEHCRRPGCPHIRSGAGAKLEAGKILADARLYAESAERELKQQAETQKNRMAENARSIASGVMLVRERLARVDERLSAATLDLDGLTQAIYQHLTRPRPS